MPKLTHVEKFRAIALSPLKIKLLMLLKLPMAFLSGIRINQLNEQSCHTLIRFKWLNQNPFKSIYFACLGMAAELSTGALAMMYVYRIKPSISMLVLSMKADFTKKAIGKIRFECNDGELMKEAVHQAILTKEGQTVEVKSTGIDEKGDIVATFLFTWTFKSK